jgi:hypothetical protein
MLRNSCEDVDGKPGRFRHVAADEIDLPVHQVRDESYIAGKPVEFRNHELRWLSEGATPMSIKPAEAKVSLLDIDFDEYLAVGGSLLNLALMPSITEKKRIERWLSTQEPEVRARVARVAEFLNRVDGQGPDAATIGGNILETRLRAIWRSTVS